MPRTVHLTVFLIVTACFAALSFAALRVVPRRLQQETVPLPAAKDDRAPATQAAESPFAGVESCRECHEDRVQSYARTSHARSFQAAEDGVPGDFRPGHNALRTRVPDLRYEMTRDGDRFYQTSIEEFPVSTRRRSQAIDLVMGSGKYAHAYMYRQGNRLYQLPVAFFTPLGIWVNPPGYSDRWAWWDRPMTPRCLECHATYFEHIPGSENAYVPGNSILAIGCERCHGPAKKHIAFHRAHPDADVGAKIVSPGELSRQRQLEVCGQCHGTVGMPIRPPFTYVPGEPLDEYLRPDEGHPSRAMVHAVNQVQQLSRSKCFQNSDMTCTTCHDPHVYERGETVKFSQRCLDCHETADCPQHRILGRSINTNCLDCHMPKRSDQSLPFNLPGHDKIHLITMREHMVAVYPEDAARVIERWPRDPAGAEELDPDKLTRRRQANEVLRQAELWLAIDQPRQAIVSLETAEKLDDPQTLALLGKLLVSQKRYAEASDVLRRALRLDPAHAETVFHLGVALAATGHTSEAVDCYCEALRLEPEQTPVYNHFAWLLATADEPLSRDGALAVELAETAARHDPDSWHVLDTLAAAYAEAGRFLEAIRTARKAIGLCRKQAGEREAKSLEMRMRYYERRQPYRENYEKP